MILLLSLILLSPLHKMEGKELARVDKTHIVTFIHLYFYIIGLLSWWTSPIMHFSLILYVLLLSNSQNFSSD